MQAIKIKGNYEDKGMFSVDENNLEGLKFTRGEEVELFIIKSSVNQGLINRYDTHWDRTESQKRLSQLSKGMKRKGSFLQRVHKAKNAAFELYEDNKEFLENR